MNSVTDLHLKMELIETHAEVDKTCSVDLHQDGMGILDLLEHQVVIHVSNVVSKVIKQENVQMRQVTQDLREHLEAVHVSNVAKRDIRRETARILRVNQDLLEAVRVSNVVKRGIKREIVQMQTFVIREEIRGSVEATIGMATIEEAIEKGMV